MDSRRAVLEVFKLVDPKTVLLACEEVSSLWRYVGNIEELWLCFLDEFNVEYSPAGQKERFRTANQAKCNLLYVKSNVIYCYNCAKERLVGSISMDELPNVSVASSVTLLLNGGIVICGGIDPEIADRTLRVMDGAVLIKPTGEKVQLQSMGSRRSYPAAIEAQASLYLFGGWVASSINTCEKLALYPTASLLNRQWQSLPSYENAQSPCNPCIYRQHIYLCGRSSVKAYARFDIVTETFSVLELEDPLRVGVRSALRYKDTIIVLSHLRMVQFTCEGRIVADNCIPGILTQSYMNPVVVQDKCYTIDHSTGLVYSLNLETLQLHLPQQLPPMCRFTHR